MTEYWKSTPRKWCQFCKIYITDSKSSITNHETGTRHKTAVKEHLIELSKKKKEEDKEANILAREIKQIQQAGEREYRQKDLGRRVPSVPQVAHDAAHQHYQSRGGSYDPNGGASYDHPNNAHQSGYSSQSNYDYGGSTFTGYQYADATVAKLYQQQYQQYQENLTKNTNGQTEEVEEDEETEEQPAQEQQQPVDVDSNYHQEAQQQEELDAAPGGWVTVSVKTLNSDGEEERDEEAENRAAEEEIEEQEDDEDDEEPDSSEDEEKILKWIPLSKRKLEEEDAAAGPAVFKTRKLDNVKQRNFRRKGCLSGH